MPAKPSPSKPSRSKTSRSRRPSSGHARPAAKGADRAKTAPVKRPTPPADPGTPNAGPGARGAAKTARTVQREAAFGGKTKVKTGRHPRAGAGAAAEPAAARVPPHPPETPLFQVICPDGSVADPDALAEVGPDLLVRLYRAMWRSRELDKRMTALQRQGRIGFYGTSTGEEAAVFGSAAAFEERDWIFPALRQGGVAIWRGYDLVQYVSQCIGNDVDVLRGRQMPCHYAERDINQVSWSSVIASQLPQAVGAAVAARYRKDDVVVAGYLGDGATSEPDFHVAVNFAGVYRAPCVFICHNNQWAISVPFSAQTASAGVAVKAKAYGIPGVRVDGNDVVAVYLACREAVARARRGEGPTLIEALTYRLLGHTTADDPDRYRDEGEAKAWAELEPLSRTRALLEETGLWDESREHALAAVVKSEIDRAVAQAEGAGPPAEDTLFDDVYAELPPALQEQRDELRAERRGR